MPANQNLRLDIIAERFLRGSFLTWEDNAKDVISHLGQVIQAIRVFAYKNVHPVNEHKKTSLRYEWLPQASQTTVFSNSESTVSQSSHLTNIAACSARAEDSSSLPRPSAAFDQSSHNWAIAPSELGKRYSRG